jgi:hypothetical protein
VAAGGDTLRGTVRVVGAAPFPRVVLQPRDGGSAVPLGGPDATLLRNASGLVVVVRGERGPREFRVTSFAVREADGQPAVDGVVVRAGDGLALDTETGRVELGHPPAALRDLVGQRVWVAGPLATGPNSYGVLKK